MLSPSRPYLFGAKMHYAASQCCSPSVGCDVSLTHKTKPLGAFTQIITSSNPPPPITTTTRIHSHAAAPNTSNVLSKRRRERRSSSCLAFLQLRTEHVRPAATPPAAGQRRLFVKKASRDSCRVSQGRRPRKKRTQRVSS